MTVALAAAGSASTIPTQRLHAQEIVPPRDADPGAVFDSLWQRFDERYALLGDKRVPWQAMPHAYRTRALSAASEEDLFHTLAEMLALLHDNHVSLVGWGNIMSAAGSLRGVGRPRDFSVDVVRTNYLVGTVNDRPEASMSFGWLPDSVGYVHLRAMGDLDASRHAIDEALALFSRSRGLVLDLRYSLGGDDPVGQALADRLADRPRRYMVTRLKSGPGPEDFTAPRHWIVTPPVGGGYTRPVVVLTHGYTFSASENFLLALRTFPHVVVVGTETAGSMGETTNDVLPNGWVYRTVIGSIVDVEGRSWEGIGITPDVRIANDPEEILGGRDRALEMAMALATAGGADFSRKRPVDTDPSLDIRLPLADSLGAWLDSGGLRDAMARFARARADTARWFLAEDWEYGDLTSLGRGLLAADWLEEAISVLEAAAASYPASYRPHVWLHQAFARTGRTERAAAARARALTLNPRLYQTDVRAAIEMNGRIPASHEFLERLFDDGAEEAIRSFRHAMATNPDAVHVDPLLLVRGGQQLRGAAQFEAARQVFDFVAEEFPDRPLGHLGLAEVARSLGDKERALEHYERALEIEPRLRRAREATEEISGTPEEEAQAGAQRRQRP